MSGSNGSVGLIILLLSSNIAYLVATFVLSYILSIPVFDLFSGPLSGAASMWVSAWVAVGAILGVADFLSILGFVGTVLDAAGGR